MRISVPGMALIAALKSNGAKRDELDGIAELLGTWDYSSTSYAEDDEMLERAVQEYRKSRNPLIKS